VLAIALCALGVAAAAAREERPSSGTALRDPTEPWRELSSKQKPTSSQPARFKLSTIVFSPERKLAVIDDVVVGVGDSISGMRVQAIHPTGVQLASPTGALQLRLGAPTVKTPIAVKGTP
jgi:hypothetical protein